VIGALVIFSGGVILAVSLSRALTMQMSHATLRSEVSALGRQTMDSLNLVPYDQAAVGGPNTQTVPFSGRDFSRTITVVQDGVRARRIEVQIVSPLAGGPTFNGTAWVVQPW
jgi:hypothetical protein